MVLEACGALRGGAGPPVPCGVDWHRVVELGARTGVLALLAEVLGDGDHVPGWVRRLLAGAHEGSRLKTRLLLDAAREIAEGMDRRGVPCAFRKGTHLASLYPTIATRGSISDLDLYLGRSDLRAGLEVLDALGYEPYLTRVEEIAFSMATESNTSRVRRTGAASVYVDLSTQVGLPRLTRTAETSGHELLAAMLARRQVSGEGIPVLAVEDLLVDVVVNFYVANTTLRNLWEGRHQRLRAYTDVMVADAACPPGSSAAVAAAMRASSLEGMASYTRQAVAGVLPGPGPAALDFAPPLTDEALLEVGRLDLPRPYPWAVPHRQRVFAPSLPPDLPPSTMPASHG